MVRIEDIMKPLITFRYVVSDNFIFKLHYRFTVLLLVILSFIITCKVKWGDSFSCIPPNIPPTSFVETNCYATGTFISASSLNKTVGRSVPYAGIDRSSPDDIQINFDFYSMVNLVLLAQAFNFYIPRLLWKMHEKGLISRISSAMDKPILDDNKKDLALCNLTKYLLCTQGKHVVYTCVYLFCETLNFVITVGQLIWLVNFFQVTGIPSNLNNIPMKTWNDFANYYFPMNSKCLFHKYGASGAIMRYDVICSLPLNRLYMYIFLFLYAWYIFLAILSAAVLIYRFLLLLPFVRNQVMALRTPVASEQVLPMIINRLSFCDWFFLFHLQKNILPVHFQELLVKLTSEPNSRNTMKNCKPFEDATIM